MVEGSTDRESQARSDVCPFQWLTVGVTLVGAAAGTGVGWWTATIYPVSAAWTIVFGGACGGLAGLLWSLAMRRWTRDELAEKGHIDELASGVEWGAGVGLLFVLVFQGTMMVVVGWRTIGKIMMGSGALIGIPSAMIVGALCGLVWKWTCRRALRRAKAEGREVV